MSDWPRYDMDFLNGRRQRRLRRTGWMRDLVRETTLTPADLIWPLFIIEGHNERTAIKSMPGVERLSVDLAVKAAKEAAAAGIPALALFPNTPDQLRNADGSEAYNPDNLMCRALRAIKSAVPEIGLIADVALDEYSSDGQDGLVRDGEILNDETVAAMVRSALVQAAAGADIIAPSDMMDGRVAAIRQELDAAGHEHGGDHGPIRPSSPRPTTARSARRSARASGCWATRRPTSWTTPTPTRHCAKWRRTSTRAPTW